MSASNGNVSRFPKVLHVALQSSNEPCSQSEDSSTCSLSDTGSQPPPADTLSSRLQDNNTTTEVGRSGYVDDEENSENAAKAAPCLKEDPNATITIGSKGRGVVVNRSSSRRCHSTSCVVEGVGHGKSTERSSVTTINAVAPLPFLSVGRGVVKKHSHRFLSTSIMPMLTESNFNDNSWPLPASSKPNDGGSAASIEASVFNFRTPPPPANYGDDTNEECSNKNNASTNFVDGTFGIVRGYYDKWSKDSVFSNVAKQRRLSSPLSNNFVALNGGQASGDTESCCSSSSSTASTVNVVDDSLMKTHQQYHENLMKPSSVRYIDTHCHIDLIYVKSGFEKGLYSDFKADNKDTWSPRYFGCIADFCFPSTYTKSDIYNESFMADLSKNDDVWLALGVHPHQADVYDGVIEEFITKWAKTNKKLVAIGEMGLDYSNNNQVDHDVQKETLRRQLQLAVELQKPILLHCRDANDDCYEIFDEVVPVAHPIHWHCFVGNYELSQKWSSKFTNLYFGITPGIYSPRYPYQTEFCRQVALDRLLIETDAPYFVPPQYRLKRFGKLDYSHPGLGALVGLKLAEIRNTDVDAIMEQLYKNTVTLYDIQQN